MSGTLSPFVGLVVKAGLALFLANEVRGFVLAAPVLYGMYEAGGTIMAIWLGICSLAGIALSVVGPLFVARKLGLVRKPAFAISRGSWRARQDSNLRPQA